MFHLRTATLAVAITIGLAACGSSVHGSTAAHTPTHAAAPVAATTTTTPVMSPACQQIRTDWDAVYHELRTGDLNSAAVRFTVLSGDFYAAGLSTPGKDMAQFASVFNYAAQGQYTPAQIHTIESDFGLEVRMTYQPDVLAACHFDLTSVTS